MNSLIPDIHFDSSHSTYPPQIHGDLRIILQIKDHFIKLHRYLEEYRRLVDEQSEFLTKDYIDDQITAGESEIIQLRIEIRQFLDQTKIKIEQNEKLIQYLIEMGYDNPETSSPRRILYCRSPIRRTKSKYINYEEDVSYDFPVNCLADTVREIMQVQKDIRLKARSLLEFYHDAHSLQLHFILITTQVCSYCMPLITENISLIDRIFFWSYRPELEMVRKNTDITDRLKDVYTSVQYMLSTIGDTVIFLKQKIGNQRSLEKLLNDKSGEQQREKDKLLRKVHCIRQDLDLLDEENDRLVGLMVKTNPDFVNTREFYRIIETMPRVFARQYVDDNFFDNKFGPDRRYNKTPGTTSDTDQRRSLKDKLMGRTKDIFEATVNGLDNPFPGGNVRTFKGGLVAELSEVTSCSDSNEKSNKYRKPRMKSGRKLRDDTTASEETEGSKDLTSSVQVTKKSSNGNQKLKGQKNISNTRRITRDSVDMVLAAPDFRRHVRSIRDDSPASLET